MVTLFGSGWRMSRTVQSSEWSNKKLKRSMPGGRNRV